MRYKGLLWLLLSLPSASLAVSAPKAHAPVTPASKNTETVALPGQTKVPTTAKAAATHAAPAPNANWYDNLIFKSPSMTFELIRTMGYTYSQGADIGESISTAKKILEESPEQWYQAWLGTANRLYLLGQKFSAEGDSVSARMAFFRASNYYRTASFYMDAPENRSKGTSAWKMSQQSFLLAIASLPYIKSVNIPYENTSLHGYFITTEMKDAPLLIVNTGFDGTAEELYFAVAKAAYQHGYHVLFFDGPGQGQSIKAQNMPFQPEWEKVIHAAINFAVQQPNVDSKKIALLGISMGGYLALRACAFEPRLKACVLDPGVYNFVSPALARLPVDAVKLLDNDTEKFDQIINKAVKENIEANWFYNNGMWAFGAKTPAEFLRMAMQYKTGPWVRRVRAPVLVIKNAGDRYGAEQAHKIYQALPGRKTFYVFSPTSTGEAHCQMGAMAISNEVLFNWLNKVFNYRPMLEQEKTEPEKTADATPVTNPPPKTQ